MSSPAASPHACHREHAPAGLLTVAARARLATATLHLHVGLAALSCLNAAWGASLSARAEAEGPALVARSAEVCAGLWSLLSAAQAAAWLGCGVAFLRWLHATTALTRDVAAPGLRWSPAAAVWSFFIPLISVARPYLVLRDLRDALAPGHAPPPPVAREDVALGYRDAALASPPPPAPPAAPVGAWWSAILTAWLAHRAGAVLSADGVGAPAAACVASAVAHAATLGAAALGARVVGGVTARLALRLRGARAA